MIILIVLAAAAYWYFMGTNKAENVESVSNHVSEEAVELNESETQAIDILKDEILQDNCKGFAKEEGVKEDKLEEYLDLCIEQLRAEATMVEPGLEGRSPEEIKAQCSVYAKEDKITKEKLDGYMDLCTEQLIAEDTMVEPEQDSANNSEGKSTVEVKDKKDAN